MHKKQLKVDQYYALKPGEFGTMERLVVDQVFPEEPGSAILNLTLTLRS